MQKRSSLRLLEICILAGGLSRRMGRDKARLRLGNRTMLGHIRATARAVGTARCAVRSSQRDDPIRISARTISRDLVPRCGPLGGIFTALKTTRADAVLFLACDMPFVSAELLKFLLGKFNTKQSAFFTQKNRQVGFPFLIARNKLSVVEKQIARKEFSLQKLASILHARKLKLPRCFAGQLRNINTPADLKRARQRSFRRRRRKETLTSKKQE